MKGILIVCHGGLAAGLMDSVEMLMGKQQAYDFVSLQAGDQPDEFAKKVYQKIISLDTGEGVLVFVDVFGGTPFHALVNQLDKLNAECVTGVNIPMLIEAFNNREEMASKELAHYCCEVGASGIRDVGDFLNDLKKQ